MKLVVLVKHVPDVLDELEFNLDLTVDRAAVRGILNEPDTFAVEQAMRIARCRLDYACGRAGRSRSVRPCLCWWCGFALVSG